MKNRHTIIIALLALSATAATAQTDSIAAAASQSRDSIAELLPFDLANAHKADIDDGKALDKKRMNKTDYIPEIHGTVRGRYEYCTTLNAHRFQVRNARMSITGNVHPIVAYKAEIDFSDKGTLKMLDAYARVFPVKGLALTIGQMKVPFSTDNLRSPHMQYFANRSFLVKETAGTRDVGFTAGYTLKEKFPFSVVAGIYNGLGLTEQKVWKKHMCYSARATFDPCKYINFSLNFQSFDPDSIRMNVYDVGIFTEFYGAHIEAEYLYKTYEDNVFKPSHAFSGFVNYDLKLPKVFSKISFLARYDMMTDHSHGYNDADGYYNIDDVARQRITAGVTLSLSKPFFADLRINYEKYFYDDWTLADDANKDKLVIEMVVRF